MILTSYVGVSAVPLTGVDGWTVNSGHGAASDVLAYEKAEKATHFAPGTLDIDLLGKKQNEVKHS